MEQTTHLLFVEDDADLRSSISEYLGLSGFGVTGVGDAASFFRELEEGTFDLALVDIGLPDLDGAEIVSRLRARKMPMGIAILSARTRAEDRIRGYAHGADLYFTKPVNSEEMVLALRNLHQRNQAMGTSAVKERGVINGWTLDQQSWLLISPDDIRIPLTTKEFNLMRVMADRAGEAIKRETLLTALCHAHKQDGGRSLEATIRRLRQKVLREVGYDLPLKTIHAVGFVFTPSVHVTGALAERERERETKMNCSPFSRATL